MGFSNGENSGLIFQEQHHHYYRLRCSLYLNLRHANVFCVGYFDKTHSSKPKITKKPFNVDHHAMHVNCHLQHLQDEPHNVCLKRPKFHTCLFNIALCLEESFSRA